MEKKSDADYTDQSWMQRKYISSNELLKRLNYISEKSCILKSSLFAWMRRWLLKLPLTFLMRWTLLIRISFSHIHHYRQLTVSIDHARVRVVFSTASYKMLKNLQSRIERKSSSISSVILHFLCMIVDETGCMNHSTLQSLNSYQDNNCRTF